MVQRAFRRVFEELVGKKTFFGEDTTQIGRENVPKDTRTDTLRKPSCVLHETLADIEFSILLG